MGVCVRVVSYMGVGCCVFRLMTARQIHFGIMKILTRILYFVISTLLTCRSTVLFDN